VNLPYSLQAEEALLGSILIDPPAFSRVASILAQDDFYRPDHRLIYGAIASLARSGIAADTVTVSGELERQGRIQDAGGISYLATLARDTPGSSNIETYAAAVRDRAVARGAIEEAQRIAAACANAERDVSEVLAEGERYFAQLRARSGSSLHRSLSCIEIRDFLDLKIPARAYLLVPILPAQGLMMIHGPRGLGKTHLTVGIAVAVACGGTFLRWNATAPAGVLLVDGEMPAAALQERLARAIQASEADIQAPLRIVTPDLNPDSAMPDLSTPDGQKAVDALVGDAKLIVLDNLSSLMRSGVENDAESWQPLQTWALRHRAQGRSVVFIHHSGKGGAQRGTSRREDVLDTVIGLRRPSDYSQTQGARFEVHIEKGRSLYGEDAAAFEAQLTADQRNLQTWTMKALEDSQDTRMSELIALGMKPPEVAAELGIHKSTVYRHIGKSKANGHA
jgi:hypothetical protein